jgi:uncharacterized membrane protein
MARVASKSSPLAASQVSTAPPAAHAAPIRRAALALAAISMIGVVIATYLTLTKLAGVAPICGPSGGCETVEASPYSSIFGIPVALLGLGFSLVMVGLSIAWARTDRRDYLVAAYALGLAGVLVEAYLVYLELFVIHAICLWCVGYGITVVAGWLVTVVALRRTST